MVRRQGPRPLLTQKGPADRNQVDLGPIREGVMYDTIESGPRFSKFFFPVGIANRGRKRGEDKGVTEGDD